METKFKTYDDYLKYVIEEWEMGHINELAEANLVIESEIIDNSVTSRLLNKKEFKKNNLLTQVD